MGTRAGIAVRISKDRAGLELGVGRQEDECRALAASMGIEVVKLYIDNDVEASSGKRRPGYQAMLTDMREGVIDTVIAWHSDRVVRRPDELEELITIADAHGVGFATVKAGNIDLTTASGRLVARLLGAVSKHETELKGERQSAQLEQRIRSGLRAGGGTRPFGYLKGGYELNEPEAEIIRGIVEDLLSGQSMNAVCESLHRRGVKNVSGVVKWSPFVVKRMVLGPSLAGIVTLRGDVLPSVKAQWPAVITEAQHHRLRNVLEYDGPARRPFAKAYLFTGGLTVCGRCGYDLYAMRVKGLRKYSCRSRYLVGRPGYGMSCGAVTIDAEKFEADVVERLLAQILRNARRLEKHRAALDDADTVLAEVKALEHDLEELAGDYYSRKLLSRAEWLAAKQLVESSLKTARTKLRSGAASTQIPVGDGTTVASTWERLSFPQKCDLARQLIVRITVGQHQGRRDVYDYGRVGIEWRS